MIETENTGRRIGRGGRVRGMRVGRFSRAGMALTGRYFVLRQPLSLPLFLSLYLLSHSWTDGCGEAWHSPDPALIGHRCPPAGHVVPEEG